MLNQPSIWMIIAVAPSLFFAIMAVYYRLREKPTEYSVNVRAGDDPKKLY
jgi:hypothetical protein